MSRTFRRKNVKLPDWVEWYNREAFAHEVYWRCCKVSTNEYNRLVAHYRTDAGGSVNKNGLTSTAKYYLKRDARTAMNRLLVQAIKTGTEDELIIPKEHLISDRWAWD